MTMVSRLTQPQVVVFDSIMIGVLLPTREKFRPISLERIFRKIVPDPIDDNEVPGAARFMRRCMTLDPSLRPTAEALLDDEWLSSGPSGEPPTSIYVEVNYDR